MKTIKKRKTFSSPEIDETNRLLSEMEECDNRWRNNKFCSDFMDSVSSRFYDEQKELTEGQMSKLKELHEQFYCR